MKKLILAVACMVFFAATSFAQQDTTKTKQDPQQGIRTDKPQTDPAMHDDDLTGWRQLKSEEIPQPLRTTFSGNQYTGWDRGVVYVNEAGDMYALQTEDDAKKKKVVYFDKDGKVTKKVKIKKNDD